MNPIESVRFQITAVSISEQVRALIRSLRQEGYSLNRIAQRTGVSPSSVHNFTRDIVPSVGRYDKELAITLNGGSVLDIETDGLDEKTNEIITLGTVTGRRLEVLQRVGATPEEFHSLVSQIIQRLPEPLYAFNASFEAKWLSRKLGLNRPIRDVFLPWKEKAENDGVKWPKLDELVPLPAEYYGDKQIPSREVPVLWKAWCKRRDMRCLSPIVKHVMEDLVQTMFLLLHTDIGAA